MFSTFDVSLGTQNSQSTPTTLRPKRSQVGRACHWCRLNRVKCNDQKPCANCQKRGGKCSNFTSTESRRRALPAATTSSSSLPSTEDNATIRLKAQLGEAREHVAKTDSLLDENHDATGRSTNTGDLEAAALQAKRKQLHWEGVWKTDPITNRTQYYGPSSSFYFANRMSVYLIETVPQANLEALLQLNMPTRSLPSLPARLRGSSPSSTSSSSLDQYSLIGDKFSRSQEEYVLYLYWQLYHYTVPILPENEFKEYYNALWPDGNASMQQSDSARKPSALVDIILALCIQYGSAFIPRGHKGVDIVDDDITIAGWWLFEKCQTLLQTECHNYPSIIIVQCYIYSVIYLRNASLAELAHSKLSMAVETAHILGLHREPPTNLPEAERSLCRRIWWTLFVLDSHALINLGLPSQIHMSEITCELPEDEEAKVTSTTYSSTYYEVTWQTQHTQLIKLVLAVRSIHTAFYEKCAEVITANEGKALYDDPSLLEICAEHLFKSMKALQNWVHDVPTSLKSLRKGGGEPFSTTRTALDIDPQVPFWVQRQSILLELHYHSLAMFLYRPFIVFPPSRTTPIPFSVRHNICCLNHAATLTHILHQALTEMDVINGWHEAYEYQWEATMSILGFTLSHPICPRTPSARKAIQASVAVFDAIGTYNCSSAASASRIICDLRDKIDFLSNSFHNSLIRPQSQKQSPQNTEPSPKLQEQKQKEIQTRLHSHPNGQGPIQEEMEEGQQQMSPPYDRTLLESLIPIQMATGSTFAADDANLLRNYDMDLGLGWGTDSWSWMQNVEFASNGDYN